MNDYRQFVDQLDNHLKEYEKIPQDLWIKKGVRFVNGLAAEELRRLVDIDKRREHGAFFTNTDLAFQLISTLNIESGQNITIYDPAVGAGNLLIAALKAISPKTDYLTLLGTDIHSEFIQAARLRLEIYDLLVEDCVKPTLDLIVGDGLLDNAHYKTATHIVTNPPFNLIDAGEHILWGQGKVSAAAVFIDRIIKYVNSDTTIIAILPDVLRSGSRYEKWRKMIEGTCAISNLTMLGQFDKYADVDVFSIVLTKLKEPIDNKNRNIWAVDFNRDQVVGDLFDVSVGNVVDNRDPHEGQVRPFLVSRGLVGWQVATTTSRQRQFKGRAISGPFVAVKRTSRMGDKHRAIATIVNLENPVYVDNHLIVLKPKNGQLADCNQLVEKLQTTITDDWINNQIRCRHLTVKIVKRIPW